MSADKPSLRPVSPRMLTVETFAGVVRRLKGRDLTAGETEELRREWEEGRAPAPPAKGEG